MSVKQNNYSLNCSILLKKNVKRAAGYKNICSYEIGASICNTIKGILICSEL